MRIVRWAPQQRVDLPDLTAMSFLVLGEFRRLVRVLLAGGDNKWILRGFGVSAASPANATVTVSMSLGVNGLAAAIGSEGADLWGQLIGGKDDSGTLEGNATQVLDFTGQAPGVYTVRMRFVYAEGANDNRAFFNNATNTETLADTATRYLPAWEASYANSGSEWIDLATVDWDGVAVQTNDITDIRALALDHMASSSQTGTETPDFIRSSNRRSDANTIYGVIPAIRALQRQIRDIKGPNIGGNWDWFSRPLPILGATLGGGIVAPEQTYSLSGIQTYNFTVGDNANTKQADFVGTDALDRCLRHIQATQASLKASGYHRFRIYVKGGGTDQVLSTNITITENVTIEIIGGGGGSASEYGQRTMLAPTDSWKFAMAAVNGGKLILRNLHFKEAVGNRVDRLIDLQFDQPLEAENCYFGFDGDFGSWGGSVIGLRACAAGSRLTNCVFKGGVVQLPRATFSGSLLPCILDGCVFDDAALSLQSTGIDGVFEAKIRACSFPITLGLPVAQLGYRLSLESATNVIIEDTSVTVDKRLVAGVLGSASTNNIQISRCRFSTSGIAAPTAGTGQGGLDGTGWALAIRGTSGGTTHAVRPYNLTVSDCIFTGLNYTDAGLIDFANTHGSSISGCEFIHGPDGASTSNISTAIKLSDRSLDPPGNEVSARIIGCKFWGPGGDLNGASLRHIALDSVSGVSIIGCHFNLNSTADLATTAYDTSTAAIALLGASSATNDGCYGIAISGCIFRDWGIPEGQTVDGTCIRATSSDIYEDITVQGCAFLNVSGFAIDFSSAATVLGVIIMGNAFSLGTDGRCADFEGSTQESNCVFSNNTVRGVIGAGRDVVNFGAVATNHAFIGNVGTTNARVRATTTPTAVAGLAADIDPQADTTIDLLPLVNRGFTLNTGVLA